MISYNNKFIFIHINKTAGSSIESSLKDYGLKKIPVNKSDFPHSQHFNYSDYEKYLGEDLLEYHKFTVVRNPWDRVVSYFFNGAITNGLNFNEWIIDRYKNYNFVDYNRMYQPCISWLDLKNLNQINILKFENLDKDFKNLCNILNINVSLKKINTNNSRTKYQDYYNEQTKNIIFNFFKEDIKYFNYEF